MNGEKSLARKIIIAGDKQRVNSLKFEVEKPSPLAVRSGTASGAVNNNDYYGIDHRPIKSTITVTAVD